MEYFFFSKNKKIKIRKKILKFFLKNFFNIEN